jgi:hypothetical protein
MKGLLAVKKSGFLILSAVVLLSPVAKGFPEMVRYGVASCGSCHISPNGGGIVSPYGRELSSEFLRMSGGGGESSSNGITPNEETDTLGDFDFLHGAVGLPDWLNIGGDFRAISTSYRAPDVNYQKNKLTQADVEMALTFDRLDIVATGGRLEKSTEAGVEFISRRHYVALKPSEDILFRAGRFFPAYGIGTPEQDIGIKRDLGWGPEQETYNLEMSYFQDRYELIVAGIFGRPDKPDLRREEGFSTKAIFHVQDTYSIGLNLYQGKNQSTERRVFGAYGLLGFTSQLVLLTEVDFQELHAIGKITPVQKGRVIYNKLSYEVSQGLNLIASGEQSHLDLTRPSMLQNTIGVGIQAFPIPHLEFQLQYQKIRDPMISEDTLIDHAWLQAHYYL